MTIKELEYAENLVEDIRKLKARIGNVEEAIRKAENIIENGDDNHFDNAFSFSMGGRRIETVPTDEMLECLKHRKAELGKELATLEREFESL